MAPPSWTSTAVVTALALAAAVPLLYFKYRHSLMQQERADALKLLRRVELIVGEVSVRLMHLENQVEDLLANEGKGENSADDAPSVQATAASSSLGSYYHFDSQGNKLKTKWDSYDVDAELNRLEQEEQGDSSALSASNVMTASASSRSSLPSTMNKPKLRTTVASIEHEFEAVLEFLDGIHGDEQVKETRKALVTKIINDQLARIDALHTLLA